MENNCRASEGMFEGAASVFKSLTAIPKITEAAVVSALNFQKYWIGAMNYAGSFAAPSYNALNAFIQTESVKIGERTPKQNLEDYGELLKLNLKLANTALCGSATAINSFICKKAVEGFSAWLDTLSGENGNGVDAFASRQEQLVKVVVEEYPKAIEDIKSEYGFHFDEGKYIKVAETERFELYLVEPSRPQAAPAGTKPILIIPPYVLGANILAFLPGEDRSYVHCFANQGIPTYVRVVKDIDLNEAVQVMTGEDDALDIQYFCKEIMARHGGRKVTLNGFCQGGYHSLAAILSGELDGLVDALITCATPVDGSRSKSLKEYMMSLPPRFRDISYSIKTLPNGNKVVDGRILAWVYKLRKIATESPFPTFHRDLEMFDAQRGPRMRINKTAAAINHWITYDQKDIPLGITRMSFESYITPIDKDGNLPVKLFGRTLNLKSLEEKKIRWLVCIADSDDLVDKEASLVAKDYIGVEECVFPKGHASLATSWSVPTSQCALHLRFKAQSGGEAATEQKTYRGPVCFHLDLQKEMEDMPEILVEILPAVPEGVVPDETVRAKQAKPRLKNTASGNKVH